MSQNNYKLLKINNKSTTIRLFDSIVNCNQIKSEMDNEDIIKTFSEKKKLNEINCTNITFLLRFTVINFCVKYLLNI